MARPLATAALGLVLGTTWPTVSAGQPDLEAALTRPPHSGFEVSVTTRVGVPDGWVRVGQGSVRGTRLRLDDDLGIDVSETLEASVAVHLSPRDALRATYLYYFLEGGERLGATVSYNGADFSPGHVDVDADFSRLSLDYERLLMRDYGMFLTASVGLTYVHLAPTLSGRGQSSREAFYRQELPVPIVGIRVDVPMGPRFAARASVGGGGLPRVDSGRKEQGSTVHLEQIHADAGLSVVYAISAALLLDVGYHITYFYQHTQSRTEDNAFELYDQSFRAGLTLRF